MDYARERKNINHQTNMGLDMKEKLNEVSYDTKVKRSASQANSLGKEKRKVNVSKRVRSHDAPSREWGTPQKEVMSGSQKSNELRSVWNMKKGMNNGGQQPYNHVQSGKQLSRRYSQKRLMKRDSYDSKKWQKKDTNWTPSKEGGIPSEATSFGGNTKVRYGRMAGERRHARHDMFSTNLHKEKDGEETDGERISQWHSSNKKDISRLLHSFGFAVENEDKDKLKEMKKKLKGGGDGNGENNEYDEGKFRNSYETDWSNAELKKNAFNQKNERMIEEAGVMNLKNKYYQVSGQEENSNVLGYGAIPVDYNRLKSGEGNIGDENSKQWSRSNVMQERGNFASNSFFPLKGNKEAFEKSQSKESRKAVGKKEIMAIVDEQARSPFKTKMDSASEEKEVNLGNINLDLPSIQMLLKSANLNGLGQKRSLTGGSDIMNVKLKSDNSQTLSSKLEGGQSSKDYKMNAYGMSGSSLQERNDLKEEEGEGNKSANKSPFVIIVGQLSPEMKEKLTQSKSPSSMLKDAADKSLHQDMTNEMKKIDGKRNGMLDKVYVIPVEMNGQNNLANHYTGHEQHSGQDMNTERDQESEEGGVSLHDKNAYYKAEKENPSEYAFSNEKSRKIVKRSMREQDMNGLKLVRIAPMKESELEGILSKSLDKSHLSNKNFKILIHDGLIDGESGLSSALTAARSPVAAASSGELSAAGSSPLASHSGSPHAESRSMSALVPAGSTSSTGSSSSLSNIASTVLSALSPKATQVSFSGMDLTFEAELH